MKKPYVIKRCLTGIVMLFASVFLYACGSGGGGGGSSVPLVEQSSLFGPKETTGIFDLYVNGTAITFSPVSGEDTVSISGSVSSNNGTFTCSLTVTNISATDMNGVSLRLGALDQSVSLKNTDGYHFYNFGNIFAGKSSTRSDIVFDTGGNAFQVRVFITQQIKAVPAGVIEAGSGGQSQPSSGISSYMDFKAYNALYLSPSVSTLSDGANTSLKLGSDGFPRLSYFQPTSNSLKYAAYNGSAWIITMVEDGTYGKTGQYSSLALTASNNPRISYYFSYDASNNPTRDLKYAFCNANCDQTSNWGTVTVDDVGDVGGYTFIALTAGGNPRIAYYDYTNGDLKYAKCDLNCQLKANWTVSTVDSTGDVGRYASLTLDPTNDYPRISYYDFTSGDLKYAAWNGAAWDIKTVDSTNDVGGYTSIALDPTTRQPRISYYDFTNNMNLNGGFNLKYAYCDSNCGTTGTWIQLQVDNDDTALNLNRDVGAYSSLALDSSGNPVILYYHGISYTNSSSYLLSGDLKYTYCMASCSNQANWKKVTIDDLNDTGWFTSAAISNSNIINISYFTSTNGNLNYMNLTHPVQFPTPVVSGYPLWPQREGYYSSIKADSVNNYPQIAYGYYSTTSPTGNSIKYTYWNGSAWSTPLTIYSGAPHNGWEPQVSLALTSTGKPRILFTWDTAYLMYAACNNSCETAANWSVDTIVDTGNALGMSILSPSLSMDSNNKPVMSYWQIATVGTLADSKVKYAICSGSCEPQNRKSAWSQFIYDVQDTAVDSTRGVTYYISGFWPDAFIARRKSTDGTSAANFPSPGDVSGIGSDCNVGIPYSPSTVCDGKFKIVGGLAVDPGRNEIYAADMAFDRVTVHNASTGAFLRKWGSDNGASGSQDCNFYSARGIAFDSVHDWVYVADVNNHRIQRFDRGETCTQATAPMAGYASWGTPGSGVGQFLNPYGVAVDPTGNFVYVADYSNNRIQRLDVVGNTWSIFAGGTCSSAPADICSPTDVAVNNAGEVYVSESGGVSNQRIKKYSSAGVLLWNGGRYGSQPGEFSVIEGISVDSSDNLYVADNVNYRVQKLLALWNESSVQMTFMDLDTVGNYRVYDPPGSSTFALYQAENQVSLKLASSNRPRISYYDANNQDLKYAYCDFVVQADCLNPVNWLKTAVAATGDAGKYASLALDPSGNPRIAYKQSVTGGYQLDYAQCDSNCSNAGNWTIISNLSDGISAWNNPVEADTTGKIRLNYIKGSTAGGKLEGAFCNAANCGLKVNWTTVDEIDWNSIQWNSLTLGTDGKRHTSYEQNNELNAGLMYNLKNAP